MTDHRPPATDHRPPADRLAELIRAAASAEGFDAVGFASPDCSGGADHLNRWLAAGRHADMAFLAKTAAMRLDARSLLPEARTVISLLVNYWPDPLPPAWSGGTSSAGAVAAYARGRDYHRVLRKKIDRLAAKLPQLAGGPVVSRCCVDSAPLLERDLALRAGLGWIGKNTMLIHPRLGSYVFLCEILTDLEIPSDPEVLDRCGSCTACLDACPTGALLESRTLDSRKCISYVTIEHEGDLSSRQTDMLGGHVFGCDICQDVCPFNRRVEPTGMPELGTPRAELRTPDELAALLALSADEFRARFLGTPLMRPDRQGILRNAAAVLGRTGDRKWLPVLEKAASDADPAIARAAADAIDHIARIPFHARAACREGEAPAEPHSPVSPLAE